jgi:outer membrane protein
MKQSTIINIVFAVCIIALFVLHFTDKKESPANFSGLDTDSTGVAVRLPIAYVNVDSLLINYSYSKDLNEVLLRKRENAQATLTQKARALDAEMSEFQKKQETNAFLSEQSYKSQQQRLIKKQQDLQALENSLTQDLMKEQQGMNEQLRDTIYSFLAKYNKGRKYQIIISNTMNDNIMLADPIYDITKDITDLLNENYTPKED